MDHTEYNADGPMDAQSSETTSVVNTNTTAVEKPVGEIDSTSVADMKKLEEESIIEDARHSLSNAENVVSDMTPSTEALPSAIANSSMITMSLEMFEQLLAKYRK